MKKRELGNRLRSVAELVRQGACFADIGTDHAYLPIFLADNGVIDTAICTDINKGPLGRAEINVREAGYTERFKFLLTDGALGLENMGVTDVAICGMGGELIARIIDDSQFLKNENIRLILQPMTKDAFLREYLFRVGFDIVAERYSFEGGKYYLAVLAEYTGCKKEISAEEAEFGKDMNCASFSPEKEGYLRAKINTFIRVEKKKRESGENTQYESRLLSYIKEKTELII